MDLPTRLREAIAATHDAIERLPASRAILDAVLPADDYVALLSQLWYVHAEVERLMATRPAVGRLMDGLPPRSGLVVNDLERLGAEIGTALGETAKAVQTLRDAVAESPWALLGAVYVLEGSRMGSMVLVKPLSKALGVPMVPNSGLDYHLDGIAGRPRVWGQFKAALAALPLSEQDANAAIRGAAAIMTGLHDIYAGLTPALV